MKKEGLDFGLPEIIVSPNFSFKKNIAVIILSLLLVSQIVTQYVAYKYNYSVKLGEHLGYIYFPWKFFEWSTKWQSYQESLYETAWLMWFFAVGICLMIYALIMVLESRSGESNSTLHGSARLAKEDDIKESGLFNKDGAYVGGWAKGERMHNKSKSEKDDIRHLRHNGPEHILALAPTRSGKGVGLVIPTLLSWMESIVCLDIKGENWALTSGWRQKYAGNKCLRFDIGESDPKKTISYNPIEQIRFDTDFEIGDVQNLALMIVDPDGKGLTDHWQKSAYAVLQMLILHCEYKAKLEEGRSTCLSEVRKYFMDPSMEGLTRFEKMLDYPHLTDRSTHELVAQLAQSIIDTPDEERGSIITTTKTYLEMYADPIVARNTSHSDFKISDLMNHESPVSLYLIIRPSDKSRFIPFLRIMITQIIRVLTEKMEFAEGRSIKHYKHKLLLLLDEFPSLKRMEVVQEGLAYMAGYGIKAYLIIQDLAQLYCAYGKDEEITGNCHIQIAYAPNKNDTADYLSKKTGITTVEKNSVTTSGRRLSPILGNVSTTIQQVQRPLLTADEVMRLPSPQKIFDKNGKETIGAAGDMLIFVAGQNPIYGRQILYFKNRVFLARAKVSEPEELDRIIVRNNKIKPADLTLSNDNKEEIEEPKEIEEAKEVQDA